jgi:hypothetical protein
VPKVSPLGAAWVVSDVEKRDALLVEVGKLRAQTEAAATEWGADDETGVEGVTSCSSEMVDQCADTTGGYFLASAKIGLV